MQMKIKHFWAANNEICMYIFYLSTKNAENISFILIIFNNNNGGSYTVVAYSYSWRRHCVLCEYIICIMYIFNNNNNH